MEPGSFKGGTALRLQPGLGTGYGRAMPLANYMLVIGIGKIVRTLSDEEIAGMHSGTGDYAAKAITFAQDLERL